MKKLMMVLLIAIASTSVAFGQAGKAEQAVRQTLTDLSTALKNNDSAALDRIYADGYTFVGDTGVLTAKSDRLAAFKSGEMKFESISFDDVKIHLFGDTAVATFVVTSKYAPGVKNVGGKFITTATFIKAKGVWREIAAQSTRIGG